MVRGKESTACPCTSGAFYFILTGSVCVGADCVFESEESWLGEAVPSSCQAVHGEHTSSATRASLVPGSGTLKLLLICSSRTQIQFHSFITKSKSVFPIPGTEQWEKTKLASVLSLDEGNPSPSLPWGTQLPQALQNTGAASFCSYFFQTFPQPHLPTTADVHWQWPVLAGCPNSCPSSNHINAHCPSTNFTWHKTSLCSSTRPKSSSFTQYFLLDLLINT